MSEINALKTLDIPYIIIGMVIIIAASVFVIKLIDWIIDRFGIETKASRQNREDHELLIATVNRLEEFNNTSTEHDNMLNSKLDKLEQLILDDQIDSLRYKILDFSAALSNGRTYNKEQFDHILKIHEKYNNILEEHNLTNGQVTISMNYVTEVYKEKLKNGF